MTAMTAEVVNPNMPPVRLDPHGNRITREHAEEIFSKKLLPQWRKDTGAAIGEIAERAGLLTDRLAKSSAIDWALGTSSGNAAPPVVMRVGDDTLRVHSNALAQSAELADIPQAYVSTLAQQDPELLVANLNKRFDRRGATQQLIRSVGKEARAVLSNKYRRLDSRPIVEVLAKQAQNLGLLPMGGIATDLRCGIRLCLPQVFEVIPGEFVMFGLNWSNSDFGKGANSFSSFFLRVLCNNGMVTESALRQIHLGRRLDDDDMMSQRTLELDTATAVSAAEDLVKGYLSPAKVEEKLLAVRAAAAKDVTPQRVDDFLKKHLTKENVAKAKEAYLSADVEMIPPGQNVWRLSNALSWLANAEGMDKESALEMQELAGKALTAL